MIIDTRVKEAGVQEVSWEEWSHWCPDQRFEHAPPNIVGSLLFIKQQYLSFASLSVLVGLYEEPERPSNAVDYIKRYMGAPAGIDVEALRAEVDQLRADKARLEAQVKEMSQVGNP